MTYMPLLDQVFMWINVCISTGCFSKTSKISVSFVFASNTMTLTATEGLNAASRSFNENT